MRNGWWRWPAWILACVGCEVAADGLLGGASWIWVGTGVWLVLSIGWTIARTIARRARR